MYPIRYPNKRANVLNKTAIANVQSYYKRVNILEQ